MITRFDKKLNNGIKIETFNGDSVSNFGVNFGEGYMNINFNKT